MNNTLKALLSALMGSLLMLASTGFATDSSFNYYQFCKFNLNVPHYAYTSEIIFSTSDNKQFSVGAATTRSYVKSYGGGYNIKYIYCCENKSGESYKCTKHNWNAHFDTGEVLLGGIITDGADNVKYGHYHFQPTSY